MRGKTFLTNDNFVYIFIPAIFCENLKFFGLQESFFDWFLWQNKHDCYRFVMYILV